MTGRDGGLELVGKADAVLSLLEARGSAGAHDLAAALGEPVSSVYRLLQTLVATGWVERAPQRGGYRLGLGVLGLARHVADRLDVRTACLPSLRRLRTTTGATSFLCVRRGSRAVCLERLEGEAVQSLALQLGGSLPLFAGAAPRVLLAHLPAGEVDAVLASGEVLAGDPPPPDRDALAADLARVRARGHAVSDGDVTPGVAALGVPVRDHRDEVVGALSVSGLRVQVLGDAAVGRTVAALHEAGAAASAALGRASS